MASVLMSYFHSIREIRERGIFSCSRLCAFKLPSRGKTKRIQSNVLSFIFIRLHPSTSLSVSRWNKILSLSPSTTSNFLPFSLSHRYSPPPSSPRILSAFFFIRFYFVSQTRKREFILLSQNILSEYCRIYNEMVVPYSAQSNKHPSRINRGYSRYIFTLK